MPESVYSLRLHSNCLRCKDITSILSNTFQDDLFSHAVLLKEANAISVELRKKVSAYSD